MKKIFFKFIIGLSAIILFNGCKKIDDLLTFPIENTTEFTIPSNAGLNIPIVLDTEEVKTSSTESFKNNNTQADLVKDVKLKELNLTITNPSSKTFSFLKSIEIYISGDGIPETLLASKSNITNDVGSVLELIPTDKKLDFYIKQPNYTLRTEIVTDETIYTDITIQADMTFTVVADPL